MTWNNNRRNAPFIGPGRRVPVRRSPGWFDSPFDSFFGEEIAPARPRRQPPVTEQEEPARRDVNREEPRPAPQPSVPERTPVEETPVPEPEVERPIPRPEETDWKAAAMRLQAEMENFRKRQTRRVEEAAASERERLLLRVLPVADNIARALSHSQAEDGNLRQGIELINRELQRFLESEGVTPIEAVGQPFDPTLHEAIGTRPANAEPDTVVDEVETGYKLGDKLLRPARVVVAAA